MAAGLAIALVVLSASGVGRAPSAHGASGPSRVWSHTFGGWNRSSSPTIADVNGDGRPEIVHGHQDGWLRVLDAATGTNIAHWPQPVIVQGGAPTAIDGSPAVADLDRDGAVEIVVPAGSTWRGGQAGGIVVFRRDGSVRCRWVAGDFSNISAGTPGADGWPDGVFSSPSLGDVDGDGHLDIVFGGWDLNIHALDRNCRPLSGFPFFTEDTTWASPALYDIDGDGRLEIFIGSDQSLGGPISFAGGEFRALDWSNGRVGELWKRQIRDVIHSSPAIGDINGDGRLEAVVGGGNYYNHPDGRRVWAFDLQTGADVPGWPVTTGGPTFASPAIGDLDGDGVAEVVAGSNDGVVRALRGNGSVVWQTSVGGAVASPIIADMDGDGNNDVGVGNSDGFRIIDGRTGAIASTPMFPASFESAGAVGNFGSLGWRLFVSGFDTPGNKTTVASYSIPAPRKTPPWPMFRRDAMHRAAPPSGGPPLPPGYCARPSNPPASPAKASAPRGYWMLGADGGVFSFGGAPFFGSVSGRLLAGEQAVALQPSPTGNGYYVLTSRGRVFVFGDARHHGSMDGQPLNAPIVAIAPTAAGNGYWLLGRDGGVFSFGDARFFGSTGGMRLNAPVISIAATKTGRGYWLLAQDGGVFSFGDARFFGSTGGMRLAAPVISMAAPPTTGYWLVALDGGVFSFGLPFYGSLPGTGLCGLPVGIQIRPSLTGRGYYVLSSDGGIWAFGDAKFHGSYPGLPSNRRAVDLAVRP